MRPHYHARKHTGCVVTVKDGRGYGVGTKREQATEQLNDRTTAHRAGKKKPGGKNDPTPCTLIAVSTHLEATLLLLSSAPPSHLQHHLSKGKGGGKPLCGNDTGGKGSGSGGGMRLASDGETVMSNGDMEYLGGEGERQQGQVTKQSADVGVAEVHICMRRTDRLHCHQHTEQHGMSGGEAGNGLVDGLRGGLKVIEQPQTISLRLVGEQ
jgi:hypothetical protein